MFNVEEMMELAYEEALKAYSLDEVPVGAILIDSKGEVVAKAHNLKERMKDSTAHAEMLAIKKSSLVLDDWRLLDTSLFVTLEPCLMCLAAILHARIKNLYFGAYDFKYGAFSHGYSFHKDGSLNHKISVQGGIHQMKCASLMQSFFRDKRKRK